MGHWGRHFPTWTDGDGRVQYAHWGEHFPEDAPPGLVPPVPPAGVPTGELVLETGATVTWSWMTSIHKNYDGTERRAALVDDPAMRVEGSVLLRGDTMRLSRAKLARYAARGEPFLFGLPWEGIALRAKSTGKTAAVWSTLRLDWALPGMRVLVAHRTYGARHAVIQSVTADSITLDVTLGQIGSLGAQIMPVLALFLDAQQAFDRYPDSTTEHWRIKARNASAGFSRQSLPAVLELGDPLTHSGALDGARLVAVVPGESGNDWEIVQHDDASTSDGELHEDPGARTLHIRYMAGATTMAQYATLLLQSTRWRLLGTWSDSDVLAAGDDVFGPVHPSGGSEPAMAEMGRGVTLGAYRGRPVWERGLDVEGSVTDSIQSMAEPQDLGGLPFVIATTNEADGGRTINVSGPLGAFQYVKKFAWSINASQVSFWLGTGRKDLRPLAVGTGTLAVAETDLGAWLPDRREHLEIVTATGSIVRARIASRFNGTLHIVDEGDAPISLGTVPRVVSWLELCRLEQPVLTVQFLSTGFQTSLQARAVQQ